jgi:hypothetical protein
LARFRPAPGSESADALNERPASLCDELELAPIAEWGRFVRRHALDSLDEWEQLLAGERLRRILLLLERELNSPLAHLLSG